MKGAQMQIMKQSVYITWAKRHAAARYNLANSGLLGCETGDLAFAHEEILLNGPNSDGYAPLTEAIASRYGVAVDSVVSAPGTSGANFLALATIIERGDEVIIEEPVYEPLLTVARWLGAEVKRFGRRFENGYEVDLDEIRGLISERTRLVIITRPHNPSGVVVSEESLVEIGRAAAENGAYVLVDEVYRDILFEDAPVVSARLGPQFVTTASLTKSYGLSGLRCGWIICAPELAERMRRMNDLIMGMGAMPAEAIAAAAFRSIEKLERRAREIVEPNMALTRDFLHEHRDLLDCVIPERSMIVFPRLKFAADSEPLHDLLRARETSIVPGRFFEAPAHFRLGFAVRTEDVAKGLENLSAALKVLSGK